MYNLLLYVLPITCKRMLNFSIVFQDLKIKGSNPEYERLFLFEYLYLHIVLLIFTSFCQKYHNSKRVSQTMWIVNRGSCRISQFHLL